MKRTIAIGDVHGCNATLIKLLFEKLEITQEDEIIFLGDYIDRGKNSKGVIITLLSLIELGYTCVFLRGNHEQLFLDSEQGFYSFSNWINCGGDDTLTSFDADFFHEIPEIMQHFFHSTKLYYEKEKYIFVHAGCNFDKENILEDEDALIWIRGFDSFQPKLGDKILIHGHTPKHLSEILDQKGNCINIDGGCVFDSDKREGNLVAYICEEQKYMWCKMEEEDRIIVKEEDD